MKKVVTVILCLFAAIAVFVVGISVLSGTGTQVIRFDRHVEISDGVADPKMVEMLFMVDEASDYEICLKWELEKPGIINGIRVVNKVGDTLFACTADWADLASAPIYLEAGEYTLENHYLTSAEEFTAFCDMAGLGPVLKEDACAYVEQGEWNIHYEMKLTDTHSNFGAYAVVLGIVVGLLLVVVILVVTKTDDKIKSRYDERQEIVRGRGFKYGFLTMIFCNLIFVFLDLFEVSLFADMQVTISLSMIISVIVVASYCILNDGYFALNENRKTLIVIFFFIAIINLGIGFMNFKQGYALVDGRLTLRSVNLFCGIMALVVLGVIGAKQIKDGRED